MAVSHDVAVVPTEQPAGAEALPEAEGLAGGCHLGGAARELAEEAEDREEAHLSKASLKRVSSRAAWGLLVRFEPCVAYIAPFAHLVVLALSKARLARVSSRLCGSCWSGVRGLCGIRGR